MTAATMLLGDRTVLAHLEIALHAPLTVDVEEGARALVLGCRFTGPHDVSVRPGVRFAMNQVEGRIVSDGGDVTECLDREGPR